MARKPTDFGSSIDADILTRTARGESAETIAHALGLPKQVRTIRRRQAQLKGKTPNAKASPSRPKVEAARSSEVTPAPAESTADVPDVPPADTTEEQIDRWIQRVEVGANEAEKNKNYAALASLAQKGSTLLALKERLKPIPKSDPNDNPDFKALAKQGEARLTALLNELFREK